MSAAASHDPDQTIAAIATAAGPGLRGIVRLSGPKAWEIALGMVKADESGAKLQPPTRAELRHGRLSIRGLRSPLPAMLALWPSPRTYTGQELAEIHIIGSPPLLNAVLADCLERGARHAQPGEFTLRAFLNGRMDLTRAEAVLHVIDARNEAQLDSALEQLAGGLSRPILSLRDRLLDVTAHVEANLDFTEEADVDLLERAALAEAIETAGLEIAAITRQLDDRDRPDHLPRVILVGPPNAGKSLLFNTLLSRDQAIVSPVAGTTRDYLTGIFHCHGMMVELVDTAGIEDAEDSIETTAQHHREAQANRADLILQCLPSDAPEESASRDQDGPKPPRLRVRTKSDLRDTDWQPSPSEIEVSSVTGEGLDRLRAAIHQAISRDEGDHASGGPLSARCRDSLSRASELLGTASRTLLAGGGEELAAFDLRQAIDELGKVVGEVVTDDILDRIFQRFCIGK